MSQEEILYSNSVNEEIISKNKTFLNFFANLKFTALI